MTLKNNKLKSKSTPVPKPRPESEDRVNWLSRFTKPTLRKALGGTLFITKIISQTHPLLNYNEILEITGIRKATSNKKISTKYDYLLVLNKGHRLYTVEELGLNELEHLELPLTLYFKRTSKVKKESSLDSSNVSNLIEDTNLDRPVKHYVRGPYKKKEKPTSITDDTTKVIDINSSKPKPVVEPIKSVPKPKESESKQDQSFMGSSFAVLSNRELIIEDESNDLKLLIAENLVATSGIVIKSKQDHLLALSLAVTLCINNKMSTNRLEIAYNVAKLLTNR